MSGVDATEPARSTGETEGQTAGTRQAASATSSRIRRDARAGESAGAGETGIASATHVLEQKALALEERSRWLASENEQLRDRLSVASNEIEDIFRSNKALRASLLAAERAGAADANALRASLVKAANATEASAGAATAAAAEVRAAANAAKAGIEREADLTRQIIIRGREVTAAAAAMELHVGRLEEDATRLKEIAREMTSETFGRLASREEALAAAAERNARALSPRGWEGEAARLAAEVEASEERAVNARRELSLEAATSRPCDLLAGRFVLEEKVAAMKCREAGLRDESEASQMRPTCVPPEGLQAALRTLASTAGEATGSAEAAVDDGRDSLVKVDGGAEGTGSTSRQAGVFFTNGEGGDRVPLPKQALNLGPDARRERQHTQVKGLTRVPDNDEDDEDEVGIGSSRSLWTSQDNALRGNGGRKGSRRLRETDGEGVPWSGAGRHPNRKSGDEVGEHVCGVCGAPNPSFGKLVECRLSLDRARAELGEARAQITEVEEGSAAHAEAGGMAEARRQEGTPVVESVATRDRQEQAVADLTSLQDEEVDARQTIRDSCAEGRASISYSQERVRELELEVRRLVSLFEAVDTMNKRRALFAQNDVGVHDRYRPRKDVDCGAGAQTSGGRGSKPPTDGDNGADAGRSGGGDISFLQGRSRHQMMCIRGRSDTLAESRTCEACGRDGANRKDSCVLASAGSVRGREIMERDRARKAAFAVQEFSQAAREEIERLKRRVRQLRVALREAQQRGDDVESSRFEADAAASAAGTTLSAVTAEVNMAMASRHEAVEKAFSAERQHRVKVEALEAELSRVTAVATEAQKHCTIAHGEASRLRRSAGDSDRRVASLEKRLAFLMGSLLDADAVRVHALLGRVRDSVGRGLERGGLDGEGLAMVGSVGSTSLQDQRMSVSTSVSSLWGLEGSGSSNGSSSSHSGLVELTALRHRLAASHAHHSELVRASEETVALCKQRCEVRVRAALAAGKIVAARSHQHGLVSGREVALEAACRLALVRRCFRALREDALLRSRDRSIRRQQRLKLWIGDAFERAGEEVLMVRKKRLQK